MKDLYERIKELRKSKGITQAVMGERLRMSQNNFGLLERGEIDISVSRLIQIAEALNVSLKEILFPEELEPPTNPELEREIEILKKEKELALKEKDLVQKEKVLMLQAREKAIKALLNYLQKLSKEEVTSLDIQNFIQDFSEEEKQFEDYQILPWK